MPDVIKLLETDHREVEDLFAKAASTSGAARQQVVTKIAAELTLHAEVEERIAATHTPRGSCRPSIEAKDRRQAIPRPHS